MANKGNFRASWHDYRGKAKYLITLKKRDSAPSFGKIIHSGNGSILLSNTGNNIKTGLASLRQICTVIRLWQYTIMPDHIHFLINVEDYLEEPLGNYIARMKVSINNLCEDLIFEPGFNDQIITPTRSLDVVFQYIKNNAHRLAVRFEHPEYFKRIADIEIAGRRCQAYGNLQLLDNPFKDQVVCHRVDTQEIKKSNFDQWMYAAANGGILVSPFISKEEKSIRAEAEAVGAKIILITHESFPERFKPSAHDFELCEQGRLLIISLGLPAKTELSREHCLTMNALAQNIVIN